MKSQYPKDFTWILGYTNSHYLRSRSVWIITPSHLQHWVFLLWHHDRYKFSPPERGAFCQPPDLCGQGEHRPFFWLALCQLHAFQSTRRNIRPPSRSARCYWYGFTWPLVFSLPVCQSLKAPCSEHCMCEKIKKIFKDSQGFIGTAMIMLKWPNTWCDKYIYFFSFKYYFCLHGERLMRGFCKERLRCLPACRVGSQDKTMLIIPASTPQQVSQVALHWAL